MAPETPYGQAVAADMQQIASAGGAQVARSAFYSGSEQEITKTIRDFADYDRRHAAAMALRAPYEGKTDAELRRELNRLKKIDTVGDVDYDAVLIPEGGLRLILVGSLLPFFDVDPDKVRFLGTGQWDDPAVWREPTLRGSWFAAAMPTARQKFMARYKDAYNETPPRITTLAYDGVALAAVLARGAEGARLHQRRAHHAERFRRPRRHLPLQSRRPDPARPCRAGRSSRASPRSISPSPDSFVDRDAVARQARSAASTAFKRWPPASAVARMPLSSNIKKAAVDEARQHRAVERRLDRRTGFLSEAIAVDALGEPQTHHQELVAPTLRVDRLDLVGRVSDGLDLGEPGFGQAQAAASPLCPRLPSVGHGRPARRRHSRHSANKSDCAGIPGPALA